MTVPCPVCRRPVKLSQWGRVPNHAEPGTIRYCAGRGRVVAR